MIEDLFSIPLAPVGPWDQLSSNEKAWVEFIRVISGGSDPRPTTARIRALANLLDGDDRHMP